MDMWNQILQWYIWMDGLNFHFRYCETNSPQRLKSWLAERCAKRCGDQCLSYIWEVPWRSPSTARGKGECAAATRGGWWRASYTIPWNVLTWRNLRRRGNQTANLVQARFFTVCSDFLCFPTSWLSLALKPQTSQAKLFAPPQPVDGGEGAAMALAGRAGVLNTYLTPGWRLSSTTLPEVPLFTWNIFMSFNPKIKWIMFLQVFLLQTGALKSMGLSSRLDSTCLYSQVNLLKQIVNYLQSWLWCSRSMLFFGFLLYQTYI